VLQIGGDGFGTSLDLRSRKASLAFDEAEDRPEISAIAWAMARDGGFALGPSHSDNAIRGAEIDADTHWQSSTVWIWSPQRL
jgi:hypothetical protein